MADVNITIADEIINITVSEDSIDIEIVEDTPISITVSPIDTVEMGVDTFTGDDTTKTFPLTSAGRANSILVFLSNIFQEVGTDYTVATDRKSITFITAPKLGRKGTVMYVK